MTTISVVLIFIASLGVSQWSDARNFADQQEQIAELRYEIINIQHELNCGEKCH